MIKIEFTPQDMQALNYERYHHPHPRVQIKMEALWLKSQGLPHQEIVRLTGISPNTLRSYLHDYLEGGIEKLKEINFNRPTSKLIEHKQKIEDYFRTKPPANINEAINKIEELTGIKRSPTQVRLFLKSIGMRCLKVGFVPGKADLEVQADFKKKELFPRLEEAKTGKRAVFFVDASHFVMGAFLGWVWCFQRIFIKSPSGRKRFNVLGALNAITHEIIFVSNETYINAESICELLYKLAALKLNIPITIVCDNARYQKCKLVQELAETLGIELLYLPSYSPNLN
ncbi:MAG: IS630 family transposase, partial [Hapalosiphonaceae cyanobacterium JJU2]